MALELNLSCINAISLRLSSLVRQLKVTVKGHKDDRGDFFQSHPYGDFYLSHPNGYKGHEPFGPGVLQAPQQPRPASLVSNTDEELQTIREWILECLQTHQGCQSRRFVPQRLLYMGVNHTNIVTDPIRLIEAPSTAFYPYIALSHCWGKSQHAITTRENYPQRLKSIPLKELSKTFQDAVWLTRRLGIKYLWIDSLCIVQDDVDDWRQQAATMCQVYASAYITIAASHGIDGSAGIFYESQPSSCVVEIKQLTPGGDAVLATVMLMPRARLNYRSQVHRLYGSIYDVPRPLPEGLLGRGWAFQERALSTRIVHYTRDELVWECKLKRQCECGHIKEDSFFTSLVGSIRRQYWYGNSNVEESYSSSGESTAITAKSEDEYPEGLGHLDGTAVWCGFVEYYTNLNLTKISDRGPAFSGIAQIFGQFMSHDDLGQYCAGLWETHLPETLLWSCSTDHPILPPTWKSTSRRIKDVLAPSWSWCSVSGPCHFLMSGKHSLSNYPVSIESYPIESMKISYKFDTVDGTPYGHLRRGALTLGVLMGVATRKLASKVFMLRGRPGKSLSGHCNIMLVTDDPKDANIVGDIVCLFIAKGTHTIPVSEEDEHGDILPLGGYSCSEHSFGLAVVPVAGELETYRRVGFFHAEGAACMGIYEEESIFGIAPSDVPPESCFDMDCRIGTEWKDRITLI